MYQAVAYHKNSNMVHIWDDRKGHLKIKYKPYAYKKSSYGKYVALDGQRVDKIFKFDRDEPGLYESDINPETRTLIDMYTDSDESSVGHRTLFIDIEVDIADGFPTPETAEHEITSIAIYDQAGDKRTVWILDKEGIVESTIKNNVEVISCCDEYTLLEKFLHTYYEIQPTIITGWNIDFFDIPYLYNRLVKVVGEKKARTLSPIKDVIWLKHRNRYRISGVSCLDYMALYKNFTYNQESSYSLEAISQKELGKGKIQYEGSLDDLFKRDIQAYIDYNMNDVDLVWEMDVKMKLIDLARGICHKGHVPYEDFLFATRYLDGAAIVDLKRNNIVAPNRKPRISLEVDRHHRPGEDKFYVINKITKQVPPSGRLKIWKSKTSSFLIEYSSFTDNCFNLTGPIPEPILPQYKVTIDLPGAYVKPPNPGRYKWVYDLDLTSLYPSIIMTLGISPETKVTKLENFDGHKFVKREGTHYTDGWNGWETTDDLLKYLNDNQYSIAANGVVYDTKIKGFLPSILDKWFNERVEYKNLRKKFEKEGNEDKAEYFDRMQLVTKILLNSFYGVLGEPSFRFFDIDNAGAITSTGQQLIKFTADIGNQFYTKELQENKDYCIYTDTDSTFFSSLPIIEKRYPDFDITNEDWMSEKTIEVADEVQTFINKSYDIYAKRFHNVNNHRFDIKQENVAKAGLWIAKKRYAQWIINIEGHTVSKLDVKGLDVVRSSFPAAFRTFMAEVLDDILNDSDKNTLDQKILDFKEHIKTIDIKQVMFPIGVKDIKKHIHKGRQTFEPFLKGTPVHVKSAISYNDLLKYNNIRNIREIINGEKIKWAYLKQNSYGLEQVAIKGSEDPDVIMDFVKEYIDYDKVFDSAFENKLNDFYNAMNWGSIPKNANLGKFFSF